MIDTEQEEYIKEQIRERQEIKAQEEKIKQAFALYQLQNQENQQMNEKIQEQKGQNFKFASVVNKQSHTGILSHKRLLVLYNGYLAYYSKVSPDGYTEGRPEDIVEPVKQCVSIYNIQKCYPLGNKLVVEFQSAHKKRKIRLSQENPQALQQQQTIKPQQSIKPGKCSKWIFTSENEDIKKKWDRLINRAKEPPQYVNLEDEYKKKREEEDKLRQQIEKEKEKLNQLKQEQERRRMEKEEEIRKQNELKKLELQQDELDKLLREEEEERKRKQAEAERQLLEEQRREEERLRNLELEEKERQLKELLYQKQLEEELIKKKKLEQIKKQQMLDEINNQWMYRYLQALEVNSISNDQGISYEEILIKGKFIYSVINDFKNKALDIAKVIINDMLMPQENQVYYPVPENQYEEYFTHHPHIENSLFRVYYQENIAFKIAISNMKDSFINDQATQQQEQVSVYYEEAIKHLVNEFRALNTLNNVVIQELQSNPNFSLRVPLACLIEFKGLVVLALSIPCIDPNISDSSTLLKGYNNQDQFININQDQNLSKDLRRVAEVLNLKVHKVNEIEEVELCSTIQVHTKSNNDYDELRNCENVDNIKEFAPQNLNIYFILKCGNLLPLDINLDSEMTHPHHKLRPEFLQSYNMPLNSDGLVTEGNDEIDELELSNASQYLRNEQILKLVQQFENLDILPLDSLSLSQAFHENGINMRYLGEVYNQSTLPHLKEICQVEIVARICKKIIRNKIFDSIIQKQEEVQKEFSRFEMSQNKSRLSNSSRITSKPFASDILNYQKELKYQFQLNVEQQIIENLLDFLNLLLGSGQETEFFWSSIINKQALHDYGCQVNKQDIIKGALLHSLKYHCKIDFAFDQDTGIFEQINPLRKDQIFGFIPSVKLFDMKFLDINKEGDLYKKHMKAGQNEQALQSINLKINIVSWLQQNNTEQQNQQQQNQQQQNQNFSTMSNQQNQISQNQQQDQNLLFEQIRLLSDQSELLLNFFNFEDSTLKAVQALDLSPIAHICQVKCLGNIMRTKLVKSDNQKAMECFDRAVQIIEFHLGPFHPLHTILYSLLGCFYSQKKYYEEALALYRSSLINSKKSLGDFHTHTAEVYKDIGVLYMQMSMNDESFISFEQSYKIYIQCKKSDTIAFAEVCYYLATVCLIQSKFEECQTYSLKSIRIYEIHHETQLKKLIDSLLILCRALEIIRDHEKCLENADLIWNLTKNLDLAEQNNVYEQVIKIILQVFVSNMQLEKVNLLNTLTQCIDDQIQEVKSGVNYIGFDNQLQTQGQNYILEQINVGVYNSIEEFVNVTLHTICRNLEYLYSVSFFDNYKENIFSIEDPNLKIAFENYEHIQMFVSYLFMADILKRY
ncbi:tetratricopeptide repeat protein (macronuclear) [Tetrahymena thermophila SB210]|uniref:Tetratricopeptide repeat protein n=1 Tax=Tetrahymena thermophila (strain SB210) TaxID=312017 RepID=Q239F3_TETTS|nr:tetratricopeptide repeat protein [Tetrahymena thermophila SB210]EAR93017.2 tetratricopeptide repeat protein [Tetrahymena thermophila SB210]|eukprot:XP_001013262.2 tetratricopeptide repeat protein [Tetrahymena thermophila SB210]